MFVSLFLISSSLGFQKVSVPEEHKNHIPPLSLIGIIVSEGTSSSVAVLQNKETGKTVMLTIGESILNLELTHVLEDGVVLRKGEKIYWLLLEESLQSKTDKNIRRNPRRIEKVEQEIDKSKSVLVNKSLPEREFVRSEVQERVERERALIINETRVIPNYVDGKIDGFKVISLPKKSIASEVGIQKDDVIKEINGVKLNNLFALVMLYSRIFEEERYEVLIERDKKLIHQVYILK